MRVDPARVAEIAQAYGITDRWQLETAIENADLAREVAEFHVDREGGLGRISVFPPPPGFVPVDEATDTLDKLGKPLTAILHLLADNDLNRSRLEKALPPGVDLNAWIIGLFAIRDAVLRAHQKPRRNEAKERPGERAAVVSLSKSWEHLTWTPFANNFAKGTVWPKRGSGCDFIYDVVALIDGKPINDPRARELRNTILSVLRDRA